MKKEKRLLSEKGGATVLVFFTIFTFLIVLMGSFITVTTLRKSQIKSDIRIQEIYGQDVEKVEDLYNEIMNVSSLEKLKVEQTYVTKNTEVTDRNGNKVVVPNGFKIAEDSALTVDEGVIIEDKDIIKGIGNDRRKSICMDTSRNCQKSRWHSN